MAREDEPAYQIEQFIDRYSLAKVLDMISGICGQKADHIQENWQDRALARRWQTASNDLHKQSEKYRRKKL